MNYLVTGGAGFIGSHLVERLIKKGHSIVVLDDFSSGKKHNLKTVLHNPRLRVIEGSVCNISLLEPLVRKSDGIFHLAARVGVTRAVKDPTDTIMNNILSTEAVCRMANKHKRKVIYTSSSEVYAKNSLYPFKESDDVVFGKTKIFRWSYGVCKYLEEQIALSYGNKDAHVVIVRLFNTVGERQSDSYGAVIPRFIKQAMKNENLTVYGKGNQTRCFCYVKDIVWVLEQLMVQDVKNGEIYNIGSNEEISILALAKQIKKIAKSTSEITFVPYANVHGEYFEDILKRVPDIQAIKSLCGFKPSLTLHQIITRLIQFYES